MGDRDFNERGERLAVAGVLAPSVRENSKRLQARVVKTYDQEKVAGGAPVDAAVVRHVSGADVVRSMLERAKIEVETNDGSRPERVVCKCGVIVKVKPEGRIPKGCRRCSLAGNEQCETCGESVMRASAWTARRAGRPVRCRGCFVAEQEKRLSSCSDCGGAVSAKRVTTCLPCRHARLARVRNCINCGAEVALGTSYMRVRDGLPPRCRSCGNREAKSNQRERDAR